MNTRTFSLLAWLLMFCTALSACGPKEPFPLKTLGPYQFGTHVNFKFTDSSHGGREGRVFIWYPAILPADTEPNDYNFDAEPDFSGAPYPVILSSAKVGEFFGPHLVSHGFVLIGVVEQDSKDNWEPWLIDYPLDQVAALNFIAENPPVGIETAA